MRAASVEALTPFPLASSANCFFHASKPAAVLPHCAAPALLVIHTSDTRTATATVLTCRPSVIPNSFHALASDETLARHPCRDEASSPALALVKIRVLHFGDGLLRSPSGSLETVSARVFFHEDIFVPRTRAPGYSRNGRGQTPNGGGAHGSPNQRAHVRKGHKSGGAGLRRGCPESFFSVMRGLRLAVNAPSRVVLTPRRWRQVGGSNSARRRWQTSPVTGHEGNR